MQSNWSGPSPVLIYGRYHTTSVIFAHVLKVLLETHHDETAGFHFHLVLDDRRDQPVFASLLPPDRVTFHLQYADMDPYPRGDSSCGDEAVDRWESQYGNPHLRSYIVMERALEGRPEETKWRFLFAHIEYFERLLKEIRPVLYVSGAADGLSPWVGMTVMQRNGVPVLSFSPARFEKRSYILNNPFEVLGIGPAYREIRSRGLNPKERSHVEALVWEYRDKHLKPLDHLTVRSKHRRRSPLPNPVAAMRLFRESLTTDSGKFDLPLPAAVKRALRSRRTGAYRQWLQSKAVNCLPEGEKFFFFPLQYEPEISLATQGRGWIRQLDLVEAISLALPADRWLYVKEHPSMMMGIRPISFYKELLALPHVRLLSQTIDSYQIVPKAEAVLTITGTAGWEALMHRRPVVLFGHSFYEEFEEGVTKVNGIEALPAVLRGLRDKTVSDESLQAYVAAVLERAPEGIFIEPRAYSDVADLVLSERNLLGIARVILSRLDDVREGEACHRIQS